ncbi:MAG: purine-nucleoside phosphorylase [Thermodesulfobacteriota bacterium]
MNQDNTYMLKVSEAAGFIRDRIRKDPAFGLVTGTGLEDCARIFEPSAVIDYQKIPHFPVSSSGGHFGNVITGRIRNKTIIAMQGRLHLYEGYSPREVAFPIRVMQELGVRTLILSNAAGGLNPKFRPGDLMVIADHLNLTGANPLIGPNEERWGIRFPDMSSAYDGELISRAFRIAEESKIKIVKGIYAGLHGPSLETPAEIRYLRIIGADAVGFSTVLETITAVHAKMAVFGLSMITNVHDPMNPAPTTLEQVLSVAKKSAPRLGEIIRHLLLTSDSG